MNNTYGRKVYEHIGHSACYYSPLILNLVKHVSLDSSICKKFRNYIP